METRKRVPKTKLEKQILTLAHACGLVTRASHCTISVLAGGGSDRVFYRIKTQGGTFVALSASGPRSDIRPYVSVGNFLWKFGIGVPRIFAWDELRHLVLMEDLGDTSLYVLLGRAQTHNDVVGLYRKAVTELALIQVRATPHIDRCFFLRNRTFGYEALRWESDYFLECFIRQYCNLQPKDEDRIEEELHLLASRLAHEPRFFMHRDFQSMNIMVTNGAIRIIDFQTATRGLPHYDLASLLKDAYFVLSNSQRSELCDLYLEALVEAGGPRYDKQRFYEVFELASLQRNMQALGAFAFLSRHKGKHQFIAFIPTALTYLAHTLAELPDYPALADLVDKARHRLSAHQIQKHTVNANDMLI